MVFVHVVRTMADIVDTVKILVAILIVHVLATRPRDLQRVFREEQLAGIPENIIMSV